MRSSAASSPSSDKPSPAYRGTGTRKSSRTSDTESTTTESSPSEFENEGKAYTGGMTRTLVPSSSVRRIPKLVVFDLDGCLWRPELYELLFFTGKRGRSKNHSPFTLDDADPLGNTMISAQGESLWLLDHVKPALQELFTDPRFADTKVGISSKTDEPNWAQELINKFRLLDHRGEEVSMSRAFSPEFIIMEQSNKKGHFLRLSKVKHTINGKKTTIPFEDMMFFDNEQGNCRQVASLGVTTIYCPDGGVTKKAWEKGLAHFPATNGRYLGPW